MFESGTESPGFMEPLQPGSLQPEELHSMHARYPAIELPGSWSIQRSSGNERTPLPFLKMIQYSKDIK